MSIFIAKTSLAIINKQTCRIQLFYCQYLALCTGVATVQYELYLPVRIATEALDTQLAAARHCAGCHKALDSNLGGAG
jgi:hypothetical protein